MIVLNAFAGYGPTAMSLPSGCAAIPYAEEVMGLAERGSVPWARGAASKILGALHGGKIDDLVATLQIFREVDPAPEAVNALLRL